MRKASAWMSPNQREKLRFAEAVREIVKHDPKSNTSLDIASFHRNIYRQGVYDDGDQN